MATEFFSIAQKGMGEGHEMTIKTKGGGGNGNKKEKRQ
jgi:N-methylhydantoinase B/oxoprolinase/acetone carboxylase alpha subunit